MEKEKEKEIKLTQIFRYAYPHIGGIETVINQINDSLPQENFDKEVLCCCNTNKSSTDNGIKYHRCRYLFEIASNNISLSFLWKLSRVNTDIIHYHMPFIFAVVAHFIARPKYKKMYVTYHSDIVVFQNIMKYFWGIYRKFLAKADKILVLSPKHIESSEFLKPFAEKCVVIPFGISLDYNINTNEVLNIRNKYKNKKILFSLGRHVKYKGFTYAIKAMENIENAVYLIGGSGPLTPIYREYIEKNHLENKVFLLGRLSEAEIDNYYEACDIYLFPSVGKTEAFGIVQLEAMKHSKPIINTNLGNGVNYVSVDTDTGLTVEPENVEQLSNAINQLLNNEELRLQYGRNARKRVEELFDINIIKSQYRELYKI